MLVIAATNQGFIRRAMVLCHVFFLSACITQPTTTGTAETGTELRMAIPNDWQQIEQIRLPSMNMSLIARRLLRATTPGSGLSITCSCFVKR